MYREADLDIQPRLWLTSTYTKSYISDQVWAKLSQLILNKRFNERKVTRPCTIQHRHPTHIRVLPSSTFGLPSIQPYKPLKNLDTALPAAAGAAKVPEHASVALGAAVRVAPGGLAGGALLSATNVALLDRFDGFVCSFCQGFCNLVKGEI